MVRDQTNRIVATVARVNGLMLMVLLTSFWHGFIDNTTHNTTELKGKRVLEGFSSSSSSSICCQGRALSIWWWWTTSDYPHLVAEKLMNLLLSIHASGHTAIDQKTTISIMDVINCYYIIVVVSKQMSMEHLWVFAIFFKLIKTGCCSPILAYALDTPTSCSIFIDCMNFDAN